MNQIRKGDIVVRKSYGKDVIFKVTNIIEKKNETIAILKGITERIQADSPIQDLEIVDKEYASKIIKNWDNRIKIRTKKERQDTPKNIGITLIEKLNQNKSNTGKILHLDGDSCFANKNSLLA